MPQEAWDLKKSSMWRCSFSWRSRTVRWGSDESLKKCESRTCSSEIGILRTASKGIPGAMTRFPKELRSSSGRAVRGNTSGHAGLGLELCSISRARSSSVKGKPVSGDSGRLAHSAHSMMCPEARFDPKVAAFGEFLGLSVTVFKSR